ncbi:MAG: ABC transporter ATP-binding protein [Halobacteriales archaeon]
MTAIEATDVTKTYGDVTALDDLTLEVEAGSTFGLLGTNGAGKTTLFKLLVNHIRPDAGRLSVAGMDVANAGAEVRQVVGYLPEQAGFPPSLSGREVLTFHARMRGLDGATRAERVDDVLDTVGLSDAADRRVAGYSNGMNRRLGLATALLAQPRILLLDEPTSGLDPLGVADFHRIVRRLHAEDDLTVVLSSHVLAEVEALCDAVAVLHDGRLRAAGAVGELRAAGDGRVVVEVRLTPTADHDPVFDATAGLAEVERAASDAMTLWCERADVPSLLERLLERSAVEGFEVNEPGLDRLFEALAEEERSREVAA